MKLKQLLEQLNQLAKERPEALEMETKIIRRDNYRGLNYHLDLTKIEIKNDNYSDNIQHVVFDDWQE